ncbi:MAG TPA: efflux RND transporter permease subunit, partial [Alphaproteobacteria bacterium]|nr:efflux RND transporter permease subunit [Alphaproteobacteria bacterium]
PVLATLLLRGRLRRADENAVARLLARLYRPAIGLALRRRFPVVAAAAVLLAASLFLAATLPGEFMPPLNEGDLLFMPVLLPGASLTEVREVMRTQDMIISGLPEVETVVGKLGRAETATDPAPVGMIETVIKLAPRERWRPGMTRERLVDEIVEKTRMPGVSPIMTQPIRNRIDMLATGIQTPVGIKVFGADLREIERTAVAIEEVLREVPGAVGPYAERVGDKPYLEIDIDREKAARHGVRIGDIQAVISTAIGAMTVTTTVEGRERYPVTVTWPRELRSGEETIRRVLVPTPDGRQVPLGLVADVRRRPGPAMIATENTLPYVRVFVSVDREETGLMEFVGAVERALERKIRPNLPAGVYYQVAGQYEYKREADRRLLTLVPICLFVIILLLYVKFRSFGDALILATAVPVAFVGAVGLQALLAVRFSTAVWIGYIALFGVAVEDGIVILEAMRRRAAAGGPVREAVAEAAATRVRPILMTTATTILALMPIMFATGAGSEVMRPIAVPTVGGMITCTLSNLFVVPALFAWIEEKRQKRTVA